MKLLKLNAITNSPYEDHRLISAMLGKEKYLFNNNFGNFTVLTEYNVEPNLENEFVKKFDVIVRDENELLLPKNNETIQFNLKFSALTKNIKDNPKSFKDAGSPEKTKYGIMLGDKDEAKNWLKYILEKNGASEIQINIDQTQYWKTGENNHKGGIIVHLASGFCKITDEAKFAELIKKGIGDSKYLGLGMMCYE